jgi:2-hydroxyglutarate dehydrogenase
MLYEFCRQNNVSHRNTKKWIVAQDDQQWGECEKVHEFAQSIGVPTRFVGAQEAADREPDVRAKAGVLESLSTGIVDSHGLMACLEGKIQDAGGEVAFHTQVTGIERLSNGEYRIYTKDGSGEEQEPITCEVLVNSAGLFATHVNNMLLPDGRHVKPFYAKGTYFSYSAPRPKPSVLVYPAPVPGHGGLGTHLTLDLSNPPRVRFGPDVEWVDDPNDYTPNRKRIEEAVDDIQSYLPGIERDKIEVDYCGIRPKLGRLGAVASAKGFQDFVIRREDGFPGFINLLGIESPGLTSCLAIGEEVESMLYK